MTEIVIPSALLGSDIRSEHDAENGLPRPEAPNRKFNECPNRMSVILMTVRNYVKKRLALERAYAESQKRL